MNAPSRQVKPRYTNYDGFALQDWHREYLDYDCPAIDLDLLFLEFDTGEPVALIEYKHERAKTQRSTHPSYQALIKLGTRAGVPVFAVRYAHNFTWFRVVALNDVGKTFCPSPITMGAEQYAAFMLAIRGRVEVTKVCEKCDGFRYVEDPDDPFDMIECASCDASGFVKVKDG